MGSIYNREVNFEDYTFINHIGMHGERTGENMIAHFDENIIKTRTFWLSNILRHLSNEQIKELTKELAERCGLRVTEKRRSILSYFWSSNDFTSSKKTLQPNQQNQK